MPRNKTAIFSKFLCSFWILTGIANGEIADIDNEILRLRKELTQVGQERLKVKEDAAKDRMEFASYQERTASRKALLVAETDSIKKTAHSLEIKRDSLGAYAGDLESQKKRYELLKDHFRDRIIAACTTLIGVAERSPPAGAKQTLGALSFLLNDCIAKSIDNVEGLHRLVQIIQNMEEYTGTIQTGQETSVTPQLRGGALMLRVGAVFEAVVDEDGKIGALWKGNDSLGQPIWLPLSDAQSCSMILKAINIRESKALPEFMALPYPPIQGRKGNR
jgi:hypothetical protein